MQVSPELLTETGIFIIFNYFRVFGILKGAVDGGLHVPHSTTRFPGFKKTEDGEKYDPKVHRDRIFGAHVDAIMNKLKTKSEDRYKKQFVAWPKCLQANGVATVEKLY